MLVLSIAILIIGFGSVALFAAFEAVFGSSLGENTSDEFEGIWAGFLLQGAILLGASLGVPATIWIWLTIMGCAVLVALPLKGIRDRTRNYLIQFYNRVGWKALLLALLAVGMYGSQAPCNYDTLLYHHQSTQWYSQYGSVQGVALLHYRLGFISSAFAMAAPLESLIPHCSATVVNSTALFFVFLQLISIVGKIASARVTRKDLFVGCGFAMVLLMHLLFLDPASAAPDFLVNVAAVAIVGSFLDRHEKNRGWNVACVVAAILLPLVKLSAAPVAILVCVDALIRHRDERRSICTVVSVVGCFAIIALAGTSWRQTGNLVFPIPALQWDVAWGLEPSTAHQVSQEIRSWARWGGPVPKDQVESQWFWNWIRSSKGILFVAATFGNIIAIMLIAMRTKERWFRESEMMIPIVGLLAALYMLYSAPNPRFGFGMLILGWSWIGQWVAIMLLERPSMRSSVGRRESRMDIREAVAFLGGGLLIWFCVWPIDPWRRALNAFTHPPLLAATDGRLNWFLPARVPAIGYERTSLGDIQAAYAIEFRQDQIHNVVYSYPVNTDSCGPREIPCANQKISDISLADPNRGITAGFVRSREQKSQP